MTIAIQRAEDIADNGQLPSPADIPRVGGRLLDARTGAPLAGYGLHANAAQGESAAVELGDGTSSTDGRFDFIDRRLSEAEDTAAALTVRVTDTQERVVLETTVRAVVNGDPVPILVPRTEDRPVHAPPLE